MNGDSLEASLDVEAIVGTAPGTSLYVYEASSLAYATILDTYNQVVSDNRAGVVNSSFGGCETETSPSNYPQMAEKIAQQGAALGIVFAASTGDFGTYACTFPGPGGVSTPASSPSFVAVGGTTLVLKANGAYNLEFGWNGSGGGVSALFARPSYQKGLPRRPRQVSQPSRRRIRRRSGQRYGALFSQPLVRADRRHVAFFAAVRGALRRTRASRRTSHRRRHPRLDLLGFCEVRLQERVARRTSATRRSETTATTMPSAATIR